MVDAKGDTVVDSSHATSFQNMENIFTSIEEADGKNATMANELRQLMEQREAGRIVFRNKVDKYLYCYPLSVNNWYLLTVVPVSVVDTQMNVVVRNHSGRGAGGYLYCYDPAACESVQKEAGRVKDPGICRSGNRW